MPEKKIDKKKALDATGIKPLEEALGGNKELVLFFLAWLKHDRNATKAYKFLHPTCTDASCNVLGSRQLSKVSIQVILDSYGLGIDTYIEKLKKGLEANEVEFKSITIGKGKKAKVKIQEIVRPNHSVQSEYHSKLGKLLGLEGKKDEGTTVAVQVNNLISEKKNSYGI